MFQYMLLLRGATGHASLVNSCIAVSIHAPLARSNKTDESTYRRRTRFNTCSSCEEQPPSDGFCYLDSKFQYMLLLRGATFPRLRHSGDGHVSIHAPLARSNLFVDIPDPATAVSIHAPLARSNGDDAIALEWTNVSIHAPLARSNASLHPRSPPAGCFNTCSSCEEQLARSGWTRCASMFQYMLLLRGATAHRCETFILLRVSIHAPLARSNPPRRLRHPRGDRFNTCSSCEEQVKGCIIRVVLNSFQYMLLLRGATGERVS